MSKKMWMIRAGRGAFLAADFEEKDYVAVGWIELGDLSKIKTKQELSKAYQQVYSNESLGKQRSSLGQLSRFRFDRELRGATDALSRRTTSSTPSSC